ncbi:hypothetical protein L484_025914 [Morus notabilis]|uniref:SCP domain-containing protein n=1 Tax=Morus notabilis TaxID=981085 RepID=W9RFL2_9ROSA|nr:pathogenesis-related protein PR-1 [Morus notabilis]EXB75139.1 hypothetical protein L484_025914 [Morus notabilis]
MKIKTSSSVVGFLITFLIVSSFFSLTLSLSTCEIRLSRRQLTATPYTTINEFLVPHNLIRSELGLPPLRWSRRLANYASWWANNRRGDCSLVHSRSDYGENLFWGSGKDWKPGDAVAAWAEERRYYDYYTNSCYQNQDCLHYTQMVWRSTMKIGCAKVTCYNGDTFITCNYDPHGNVIGQRPF